MRGVIGYLRTLLVSRLRYIHTEFGFSLLTTSLETYYFVHIMRALALFFTIVAIYEMS